MTEQPPIWSHSCSFQGWIQLHTRTSAHDSAQACWDLLSAYGAADVADMQAGQRRGALGRSCRPTPCRCCIRAASGTFSSKPAHALGPIALDVEYAHVLLPGHGEASVAAWVCLMAPYSDQPLLKTYCRHPLLDSHTQLPAESQAKASSAGGASKGHQLRGIGGVRLKALQGAPPLSQVTDQVRELWHGRLLVGHGVAKDLKALGVDVEQSDCSSTANTTTGSASSGVYYDTITFPEFQSKVRSGNLAALPERLLEGAREPTLLTTLCFSCNLSLNTGRHCVLPEAPGQGAARPEHPCTWGPA